MCGVGFVLIFYYLFSIKLEAPSLVWKSALLATELRVLVPS